MKKTLFVTIAAIALLIGCSKDQNHDCACNGSLGTDFNQLSVSFDSLCSEWKSITCPKDWTCTCTQNAPTILVHYTDSLTAVGKCNFYQQSLQPQHQYTGTICTL